MGFNNTGYPGAFTPTVEKIIKGVIESPSLNLYSGRSKIGDVRVDLTRPEATHNMSVEDFISSNNQHWKYVLLDPVYNIKRISKLEGYASKNPFSPNVYLRRIFNKWSIEHVDNILWLDLCAPKPKGFERKEIWLLLPGGYHNVRVLSWLVNTRCYHQRLCE